MQARDQLDQIRKLAQEAKKLKTRREKLSATGSSLEEIDAEIKQNQTEYQKLSDYLTPLINHIRWDQLRNILLRFYFEAAPMSEVLTTVIDLPVEPSSMSFAQGRKQMAIRELQQQIDRQERNR